MFGLNEISWGIFIELICLGLTGWYFLVFILSWIKHKSRNRDLYYEDFRTDGDQTDNLQPMLVSSNSFPSEIINVISEKQIPLETSFYEETGLDEGYGIELFLDGNDPKLSEISSEFQYQH